MTKEQLKKIAIYASEKNINTFSPLLNRFMHEYGICGKYPESAFLATVIHESGSFRYLKEIASGEAYEGRKDLGNTEKGDGVKYKGRGLTQLTGRRNYELASNASGIDFVSNPELLEEPENAVKVSCWWWDMRNLNKLSHDIKAVTKVVNGGYNGMADREKWYNLALKVL